MRLYRKFWLLIRVAAYKWHICARNDFLYLTLSLLLEKTFLLLYNIHWSLCKFTSAVAIFVLIICRFPHQSDHHKSPSSMNIYFYQSWNFHILVWISAIPASMFSSDSAVYLSLLISMRKFDNNSWRNRENFVSQSLFSALLKWFDHNCFSLRPLFALNSQYSALLSQ